MTMPCPYWMVIRITYSCEAAITGFLLEQQFLACKCLQADTRKLLDDCSYYHSFYHVLLVMAHCCWWT